MPKPIQQSDQEIPEEVAKVVAFLFSEDYSYVNGRTIAINFNVILSKYSELFLAVPSIPVLRLFIDELIAELAEDSSPFRY